ncbi:ureidoglycolate lyase [Roseovarius sp. A-2]|uniref:ureidoglycolate lyase n=1 Tax=Roseovarius sp. A-2 TaxID=1570360 RepID=UPI0009B50BF4|nr:ureidoglycolate lyase [Roseovarius sp. A-2]GAW36327.1 ureidoglycolate lyase [Roseovarius sp. A-2]
MSEAIPLTAAPLTAADFARYGDVIEARATPTAMINQGLCARHSDLARLDFDGGRAGISLFDAEARHLPHVVEMVERHPLGSQAFLPLGPLRCLVIVAEDAEGAPGAPHAFITEPGQSINLHRGVWHGVLTPLDEAGQFAVVDRIGLGTNLEEYWFKTPYIVTSI